MKLVRTVVAEELDSLGADDPSAMRSRRDLQRVHRAMGTCSVLVSELHTLAARNPARRAPVRLLELGAGDATLMLRVARALKPRWSGVQLALLDRVDLLDAKTRAGYAAIGQQRPVSKDDVQPVDTIGDPQLLEGIPVRPGTKLAALVVALRRPQGATSLQLMLATGWQPHTVRGAISGMLRKKLGLNVVLAHNDTGERVYRVI